MSPILCFILTSLISNCQTVLLPIPEYTLQNVHADQETVRNDFLLLETLLHDFLNIFTRPIEAIHMNKPFDKHIQITNRKSTDTTTPVNEEAKIVEELANILKDSPVSTLLEPKQLNNFIRSMRKIGMDECIEDIAKLIDSSANALLTTTFCRLTGLNETHIKKCFDNYLSFRERSTQILDAWGRPPSGIYMSGPFFWLGAYDQCLSIAERTTTNQSVQYCRANVHVAARGMQQHRIPLFYGICLPTRCNERYVYEAFSIVSRFLKKTLGILITKNSTVECFGQKVPFFKKFGVGQWAVFVIFAFLVFLVLCGTLIDLYRKRRNRKYSINKESSSSRSTTIRLATSVRSVLSEMSSKCTPGIQDDAKSFMYTDAPSQALTYKSAPAVRRTLKKWSCFLNTILAFSARSTYHYLMRPSKRHLNTLHGIRVLSAFWVVIGHAHLLSLEYVGNVRQLWSSMKASEELSQIIFNSSLSVDSFLLISGTILAYKIHFRIAQQKQRKIRRTALSPCSWLMIYVHRIMRLLPAYLISFLVMYFIFQHIGDGPMWSQQKGVFGARCESNDIWRHLLFMSNFYPNQCMPWMWYLALDTQFYIAAPIGLLLLLNAPTLGTILIFILILSSVLYRVTVMILFRFPTTLASALIASDGIATQQLEKLFRYLYTAPQARIGPFLIGILLGWLLATKPKRAYSTLHIDIIRFASLAMLCFSLFGAHYANSYNTFSVFYASTFRVFWASGLALLVWLCERGYMYLIQSCLAWEKWTVLSRLSYGFYLSHEPLLLYFVWTRRFALMPLSPLYFVVFAIEISALSLIAAAIIAFIIEIPPLIIERRIFKTIRARGGSPNGIDEPTERNEMKCEVNVQLCGERKNDKTTELAPMLPPMSRTKRWIEENHNDVQGDKIGLALPADTEDNTIHLDHITTVTKNSSNKQRNESDGAVDSGSISTCKSPSEKSTNGKPIFNSNKPFYTSNSPITKMPKRKEQLWSFADGIQDIAHTRKMMTTKHYSSAEKSNEPPVQKRKMLMKQNHSEEVSLAEHIGFSWIEEVAKKLDAEENALAPPPQFPPTKKRKINRPIVLQQQQQQPFNVVPLAELVPLSGKSSSSTNTGETVIHVIKRENPDESDL